MLLALAVCALAPPSALAKLSTTSTERSASTTSTTFQPFNFSTSSYVWGLDIDGTLQGAGGVGGLLAVVRDDGVFLPAYDANGNIIEYVSTNGEIVAHYDYSPFGEQLVSSGPLAATFTHWFSTKPWCADTGLVEYQMRKYWLDIGRWMSRDPLGEKKFINRMSFVVNNSCNKCDILGLFSKEIAGNGIVTINVQDCEIVILDGHGHKSIPHNLIFPDEGCSGGAFIGCHPDVTNGTIPQQHLVPNAPFAPGLHLDIKGGGIPQFRADVLSGAQEMAREFCESGCCDKVTVTFTSTIKPLTWYDIFSEPPRKDTTYIFNCTENSFERQSGGQDNYPVPTTNAGGNP